MRIVIGAEPGSMQCITHTLSLCRADTHTRTQAYIHTHKRGLRGNVRQKRAVMTLDFPVCLLQQRSFSRGECRFHMQPLTYTHIHTSNHFYHLQRKKQRRRGGERENKREMCTTGIEREKTSHPRNLFSHSPPPASITLSLLSIINLPMPPASLTLSFSFYACATFYHISFHFITYHENVCIFHFPHFVMVGNKLFPISAATQVSLFLTQINCTKRDYNLTMLNSICIFKKQQNSKT